MNCREFQQHLKAAVEERDHHCSSREIREHADRCRETDCCEAWQQYELLAAILPVWQAALPETDLSAGVLNRLRATTAPVPRHRSVLKTESGGMHRSTKPLDVREDRQAGIRSVTAVICAVASLLLLVPLLRLGGNPSMQVARTALKQSPAPTSSEDFKPVSRTSAVHQYASMPQSATEFVTDAMVLFVPADLSEDDDEAPSRSEQWRGRLGEQLEPIGRELGSAVDAFLDVVTQPQQRST